MDATVEQGRNYERTLPHDHDPYFQTSTLREQYLVDFNAARAARAAGYSKRSARSVGQENLTKPDIQAAIAEGRKRQLERVRVTADLVLAGLLTEAQGQGADTTPAARVAAWTQIGKHLAMFTRQS